MKNALLTLCFGTLLAGTGVLHADQREGTGSPEAGPDPEVFATVNGTPLGMNLYHFLLGSRDQGGGESQAYGDGFDAELQRQQAAKDLVMTELLAQQATRLGLHESELVAVEMAMAEKTLLAQLYVQRLMDTIHIEEAEIRRHYDQQDDQAMYRFMIWRTPDEARAREILAALKAGKEAGTTDREIMETPWLRDVDIAPDVNAMVHGLAVSGFAQEPVFQDGFWKVIQVIDRQVMARQSYEEEREIIRAELVRLKLDEKLEDLAEDAAIVFNHQHVTRPGK